MTTAASNGRTQCDVPDENEIRKNIETLKSNTAKVKFSNMQVTVPADTAPDKIKQKIAEQLAREASRFPQ